MSLQIPIQKDIGEYTEKIIGKMGFRTLACTVCGLGCAVVCAAVLYFVFHIMPADATLFLMACALPFWLLGFWRPADMKPEEFLPLFLRHHFTKNRLYYESVEALLPHESSGLSPMKMTRKARRRATKRGAELYEPTKTQD